MRFWRANVSPNLIPQAIIAQLKEAHLRGRGGAGFPHRLKNGTRSSIIAFTERYFVCNAGEHEPGTFKDRYLIKHHPHQLLEGCLIAAHTVGRQGSLHLSQPRICRRESYL